MSYARRLRPVVEALETRALLTVAFSEFIDPHPNAGNQFGATVVALSTGNVVITSPYDDAGGTDAGAVYLFNGATGALISTLTGSAANENVGGGGVTALSNGNYVVLSPFWSLDATHQSVGAVTFGNGITGVSGAVSAANSLVGSTTGDHVGVDGVTALSNGNYVVASSSWSTETFVLNGGFLVPTPVTHAGAVTFGNGTTGIFGSVSSANSLVGSRTGDAVGSGGIDSAGRRLGSVTALSNGNYVVSSPAWSLDATHWNVGAVTFGSGTTGIFGTVSAANSVVGGSNYDNVGNGGVVALTNGNYVVISPFWSSKGAVTFGNGTTGISGVVSIANSLIGSNGDSLGVDYFKVTALTNGNYVVSNPTWNLDATHTSVGAVTFGNGTTGVAGAISAANSLVGSTSRDAVGVSGVTALTNGNYVVNSLAWNLDATHTVVGAVTFGNGTTGIIGTVSAANSLVGSTSYDEVGFGGVTALTNGNYVVSSSLWDADATHTEVGAVTFGNGVTGVSGTVSAANSLVGSSSYDYVGYKGVTALTNGKYVVNSPFWSLDAAHAHVGAATFGNGTTGLVGTVSSANSLVGSVTNDKVASNGTTALANGNYVVNSPVWNLDGTHTGVGAVTFGNGTTGVVGTVSAANSLVGATTDDGVGTDGVTALTNGNYVVLSRLWDLDSTHVDAGAVTFGNGAHGVQGTVSAANSLVGAANHPLPQSKVTVDDVNGRYYTSFPADGAGRVRVGSQAGSPNAPASFTVSKSAPGNLLYTGMPFSYGNATVLTVTLSVAEGTIFGATGSGVTVGGTATGRTFVGTTTNLNAYFTTAGKITYLPPQNNHLSQALTTTVSDGVSVVAVTSTIHITGVDSILGRLSTGQWWAATSDGTPSFTNTNVVNWANQTWTDVMTGDFNGDHRDDLVGRDPTGKWMVSLDQGDNTFAAPTMWGAWSATVSWKDIHTADVDGDGLADIVGRLEVTGEWYVAANPGNVPASSKAFRQASARFFPRAML